MKAQLVRYRQFNWITIAVIVCSALLIVLLNFMVDPYGIIGIPTIVGINKFKPEKSEKSKLFKATDITRIKPKTILLGTSTTDFGMNPNHPAFAHSQPVYNLGMPGTNMYELMRYFEHALYNQPEIKQVIIGVDVFLFDKFKPNAVDFRESRLETNKVTKQDIWNSTFSLDAFLSSINTLAANFNHLETQPYDSNGERNENWLTDHKPYVYRFIRSLNRHMQDYLELSESKFDNFKQIIDICRKHNIEVKVFISPVHATITEGYFFKNNIHSIEQQKRKLVKIIPVWDFSGFNSITTEQIGNDMKNYMDAFHYRRSVGDLVLNRILHFHEETVPADFGFLMTPENVEYHLEVIRGERRKWQKDNPELVKLVQGLEHVKGI